jgi:PA domain
LFGVPPYGGSIAQSVYYADSDLCDANVNTRGGYPERDMDKDGKMKPWESPYILMVDRGGCTFVQKVRNAQRSGAAGVVIADNTCLCNDSECTANNGGACETTEPIMADDGSGADISIPSFLMFKRDADAVKAELKANRPVQIEMAWSLPNPDDRVEYDLWTVPSDSVSKDFLRSFKVVAEALDNRAYFTPHMYIYDGVRSHCQGNDGENFCYNLCTNNGRYCATDPDNDLDHGISGADVIKESLRRLCIWKDYGAVDGVGSVWWDYVREFMDRCSATEYFADDACVKDAYKHAKVDGDLIERCINDSGGLQKDGANAYLDAEIAAQAQRGVVVVPTAFVNTAAIRGALTVSNVFTAICAGFAQGTAPPICTQCSNCYDAVDCINKKGRCHIHKGEDASTGGVSFKTFVTAILFVTCVFGGLGAWHYKKTREDMRDQVRGILAEYMPLEDQEATHGMGGGSPMNFAMGGQRTSLIG